MEYLKKTPYKLSILEKASWKLLGINEISSKIRQVTGPKYGENITIIGIKYDFRLLWLIHVSLQRSSLSWACE